MSRVTSVVSCVVLVCVSWVVTGQAQSPPSPTGATPLPALDHPAIYAGPPLSLRDAIEEARQHNASLAAVRGQIDVVRQRPAQSRILPPPTFNAQIWQWPVNSVTPLDTNMYMLTMSQDIPGKGKRGLRAAAAETEIDGAVNDVATMERQVISDVKRAYASLSVARRLADLYTESAAVLRQLADVSESRYAAGHISQQDVLKPVVELSKLYDDALMARQQTSLMTVQLNALMNRPGEAPIGPLADSPRIGTLPRVTTLVQLALDHQPELQRARIEIARAKADLAVAKSDAKPDFMVEGGYMVTPRGTDAWTGQLAITWPSAPWSRSRIDARVAETSSAASAAAARLVALERAAQLGVQQAHIKATTAAQRAELLQNTILPQSRHALDVARIAYENDRADFLSVLDSQRTLLTEELDYVRLLGDLADAQAELERAIGVDLDTAPTTHASVIREGK